MSDIKIHPNFNNATLVNDIALLRLERPAKRQQVCSRNNVYLRYNYADNDVGFQNIDVVCVANSEQLDQSRVSSCYVTGWGRRTESKLEGEIFSDL